MSQGSDLRRDAALPRSERRALGAYYTPDAVVRYIVGETLTADLWQASGAPQVLDPACGDGAFLCEVAQRLVQQAAVTSSEGIAKLLQQHLFGIDCDPAAVQLARERVAQRVLGPLTTAKQLAALAEQLAGNLVVANALVDPLPLHWPDEFDAVVGNPPYVNIRRLARHEARLLAEYRRRYRCATRGFDLYVLFIERAWQLLRRGGACGFIVPNKLATLEYAAACRTLLTEHTELRLLADCSESPLFAGASVYPHIVVFRKQPPASDHVVRVVKSVPETGSATMQVERLTELPQVDLHTRGVFAWNRTCDFEARLATRRLDSLCRLHSGTTGFLAQQVAAELMESEHASGPAYPFITSGNIDRYRVQLGNVRYMKRRFAQPVLPASATSCTAGKHALYGQPKIVIAGMSRRLEAAWHDENLALGVQVFAAVEFQIDPFLLLAILNSRLMSFLFQARYPAKRLSGGFFSANKGQLAPLPIPDPAAFSAVERAVSLEMSRCAALLSRRDAPAEATPLDGQIDRLVYQLYRATAAEIAAIEAAFAPTSRRRAA